MSVENLKARHPGVKEVTAGIVSLAQRDGSLFKKTLICRTGQFDGKYGPVTVTEDKLRRVAARYNEQRATPLNENDYAPILVDHNRLCDLIQGRVMTPLEVAPIPAELGGGVGLYGPLRVDDPEGQKKIDIGKYAQVSMSFDDEATYELFEVSFVAVEAARRAQLLEQGETNMSVELEQKLSSLKNKTELALAQFRANRGSRREAALALGRHVKSAEADLGVIRGHVDAAISTIKTAALSAQLRGFVAQGKMTKAEMDGLKVAELAQMPKTALEALVKSYADRDVSSDVVQHGQQGTASVKVTQLSAAQMRAAMKAQQEGKSVDLAGADDGDQDDVGANSSPAEKKAEGDKKAPSMNMDDFSEHLKVMEGMVPAIEKCMGYMKSMSEHFAKMSEAEDKDEKAEKEVA